MIMLIGDFGVSIDKAEALYIEALTLLSSGYVSSADGDDIRIEWLNDGREACLSIYEGKNYLYWETPDGHGVVRNVTFKAIQAWMNWVYKPTAAMPRATP